jgi:hypothetical protein
MRALISLLFVVSLSACVSTPRTPDQPVFTLDGNGIAPTVSGLRIDFGRAQVGVIDTVSRLLGEDPSSIGTNSECGAGPITSAQWDDGLTLNFMDGNFVGWTSSDPSLPAAGGVQAGQPRLEMPPVSFQVTSLGSEFVRGEVFGILDETETEIALVYAGTTCFFR